MQRSDNPLAGRKGLEGSAAAFDMKSLEKHMLEPVCFQLSLCGGRNAESGVF